jgi:tetratricopeptide (TPR) repeat protein
MEDSFMLYRIPLALLAALFVSALTACQDDAGPDAPKAEAAAPETAGGYAPSGSDGATVIIVPEGEVLIAAVNGMRVTRDGADTMVGAEAPEAGYSRLLLPPGSHTVTLAEAGGTGLIDISLTAEAGRYVFAVLEVQSGETVARALTVIAGNRDGRIIAASAPVLVGMSRAGAESFMAAPPEEQQKIVAAEQPPADDRAAQAKAQFARAQELFEAERFADALAAFDETLRIAPGLDSAHVLRGLTLLRLNRPRDASDAFDQAIALGRQNRGTASAWLSWPLYNKALVLLAGGETAAAKIALDESIELKPTPGALLARANLSFTQGEALGGQGDWQAAEPYFLDAQADATAGIALAPRNAALWSTRSASHIMLNQHQEACIAARKACELGNCTIVEQFPQCKAGS